MPSLLVPIWVDVPDIVIATLPMPKICSPNSWICLEFSHIVTAKPSGKYVDRSHIIICGKYQKLCWIDDHLGTQLDLHLLEGGELWTFAHLIFWHRYDDLR